MRFIFSITTLLILLTPILVFSNGEDEEHHQMMADWMWSGSPWVAWVFIVLMWLAIVVAIAVLAKWLIEGYSSKRKSKSALEILKERYAKGEINKREFEQKKKDLSR